MQVLLMYCLMTELSLEISSGNTYFYDMTNYKSKLLPILVIYGNIIKKIYV